MQSTSPANQRAPLWADRNIVAGNPCGGLQTALDAVKRLRWMSRVMWSADQGAQLPWEKHSRVGALATVAD